MVHCPRTAWQAGTNDEELRHRNHRRCERASQLLRNWPPATWPASSERTSSLRARRRKSAGDHRDRRHLEQIGAVTGSVSLDETWVRRRKRLRHLASACQLPARFTGYSGMFPCFLRGMVSTLFANIRSARITFGRVSRGSITSSINPRSAATNGFAKRS